MNKKGSVFDKKLLNLIKIDIFKLFIITIYNCKKNL